MTAPDSDDDTPRRISLRGFRREQKKRNEAAKDHQHDEMTRQADEFNDLADTALDTLWLSDPGPTNASPQQVMHYDKRGRLTSDTGEEKLWYIATYTKGTLYLSATSRHMVFQQHAGNTQYRVFDQSHDLMDYEVNELHKLLTGITNRIDPSAPAIVPDETPVAQEPITDENDHDAEVEETTREANDDDQLERLERSMNHGTMP